MVKSRNNVWSFLFQPRSSYRNYASAGDPNFGTKFDHLTVTAIELENLIQIRARVSTVHACELLQKCKRVKIKQLEINFKLIKENYHFNLAMR